ncbi:MULTISPECIES: flagellar filament capping protein FliD [Halomonadaceae]|uniref:flagellar filament capping protein FliD n=1 Tax=Halomonadaceae TaxID=28256 RepID=UPI0012EF0B97|nr:MULTISPECIES: flagellar filament capping protein FliD [Halomonas]CAD5257147.1 Flagellar hook-associated protein 2 [Halomonas sp. 59]CAD5257379.1 Flagellar hook-associated protein 2 [Halomonas sp. 113]CAD5271225.1 Flagellar hook-associated protein fliD [Halomonas sp. I3]CAD5291482.1 Flagellar hook-associated protein 2 [Halomonas sp. 156]VXB23765.1 Flagellar hook-associated protein 2 [Halomonas titanicae]
MASITALGVGSGLDLSGLVDQLKAAEQQKLVPILEQKSAQQTKISAYGRLESAMDRVQTSIAALNDAATFKQQKSTVMGDGVLATAGETANAGRYEVTVTQLARSGSAASNSVALDQELTAADATLTLNFGAGGTQTSYDVAISAGSTLADVRDQINADKESGVTASIVNDGTGYRLALSSKETGQDASLESFSGLASLTMDAATQRSGQDAELNVNGIAITSKTNRVEEAIQGVTLDLTEASGDPVTLVIERDDASLREAIDEFVKNYNEMKSTVGRMTAYNGEGETSGELVGDRTVRTIEDRLRRDITDNLGTGDISRLSQLGIAIDEKGRLKVDEDKLDDAVANNPEGLSAFFAGETEEGGFAGRLNATLEGITAENGIIQSSVTSAEQRVDSLDERKLRMEASIERSTERYRKQFGQLDGLIAQMNSMSSYLSQQFSMLGNMQKSN